ncbi:CoA transferase [Sphingobium sp. Sx8-8]|uniref:CoA transferase n=1 Tax=Sphingobium sp. Sx8-8 TaxID=2933617 RepID=UPI001F59D81A|nr:CoA transferase [Sphingobium sp. Sx8-8]
MTSANAEKGPLADLTVVENGPSAAVAMCGKLLRELGARIFVTGGPRPDRFGPGRLARATSLFLDQGKETLAEADLPRRLESADILLTTQSADDMPVLPDGLIHAHFSAFGAHGPRAGQASSDLVAQAAGGLLALLGDPAREPLMLAGRQAAYSTGFLAFSAVMAALAHRDREKADGATPRGQGIELSDLEAIALLEWKGPVYYQAAGEIVPRGRETGPLVLPCSDGHLAFFYNPRDWQQIVKMFGSPPVLTEERFATQAGRMAAEPELKAILSEFTRNRPKHELYHLAQAHGVPMGAVETIADLNVSPQYAATRFLARDAISGSLQPLLPFTFNGERPRQTNGRAAATTFERQ